MKQLRVFMALALLLTLGVAYAKTSQTAAETMRDTVKQTMNAVKQQQKLLDAGKLTKAQNHQQLYDKLRKILKPRVDEDYMASMIIGRPVWSKASQSDKKAFIQAFEHLVAFSYASALLDHSDSKVTVAKSDEEDGVATVQTVIEPKTGPTITVIYYLYLTNSGWKVYNLSVGGTGIDMLRSYRDQFRQTVQKNGIKGAIELAEKAKKRNRERADKRK